jgi:hypothetical protein
MKEVTMRKKVAGAMVMVSLLFTGLALLTSAQGKQEKGPLYSLSVKVNASAKKGVYDCFAVAKDTKTGKEVFAPKIEVKIDDQAQASTINKDDLALTITVAVDKAGKVATYTFVAKQGDKEIQKDQGKVDIK